MRYTIKSLRADIDEMNEVLEEYGSEYTFTIGQAYGCTQLNSATTEQAARHCIHRQLESGSPRECKETADRYYGQWTSTNDKRSATLHTHDNPICASVGDIKHILTQNGSYFFTRNTMRFFGDTLRSFGVRTWNNKRIMYRKPTAAVNVMGTWKKCGREFFNCWHFDGQDLQSMSEEDENAFFSTL